MQLIRTDSDHSDFLILVKSLDIYLAKMDGDDHTFYAQYNKVDKIKYVVMAFQNDQAIGCGAIKEFDVENMEVKRMYTSPEFRGRGIASAILSELEKWTLELGFQKCILETGIKQVEAIELYNKNGYQLMANYGQYEGVENSLCFEKELQNQLR